MKLTACLQRRIKFTELFIGSKFFEIEQMPPQVVTLNLSCLHGTKEIWKRKNGGFKQ